MVEGEWLGSNNYPGEQYWDVFKQCNAVVYTLGAEFVVREWPDSSVPVAKDEKFPVIAGPFTIFEAALAAAEMINNG